MFKGRYLLPGLLGVAIIWFINFFLVDFRLLYKIHQVSFRRFQ